ncbi:dTDP-4-dehydrorhamnose reductase [Desulfopila aestuarii]|uniref:dTDP-4-dehydrorhamnose reductase n=1 Tax=Desulfopila aestuarii DSM 18488 TaxID=1121416 RepID=A0A1M7YFT0_9BACT|nr:dTDP-4-dehydrorhamnose reductase [Desulfopila aestuarii]SHO51436.1 dTDP-4-dehydrorhamnose reductase [Desulfopila aestuarii DSM 18488]
MKIAIIGCRGQLGTDCSNILGNAHDLTCCDIPQIDIGDQESVDALVKEIRPDVIINCAAYTAVDACEKETKLCQRINAEGPKHLAQAATRHNCRLIHISTDYVFDGKRLPPEGYTEKDHTNPLSEYGRTKLAGEEAVLDYAKNHVILRTAWLYSAYGNNFLKTMLRLALQDPKRPIKVVNDQYGSLTWSHTLALQIEKLLDDKIHGIVHATSEGHSTWFEGACYFLDAMNVPHNLQPCSTAEYPTPAVRPANSILHNSRLNHAGLSTFGGWQKEIETFVKMYGEKLLNEQLKS